MTDADMALGLKKSKSLIQEQEESLVKLACKLARFLCVAGLLNKNKLCEGVYSLISDAYF